MVRTTFFSKQTWQVVLSNHSYSWLFADTICAHHEHTSAEYASFF